MTASAHTFKRLAQCVAAEHCIALGGLLGSATEARYARPRQLLMLLAREVLGMSYTRIAELLERDHSTIMWGCRRALDRLGRSGPRAVCRAVIQRYSSLQQQVMMS